MSTASANCNGPLLVSLPSYWRSSCSPSETSRSAYRTSLSSPSSVILCTWIVFGNKIKNYPRKLLIQLKILADEDEAGKSRPNVIAPRDVTLGTIAKVFSRWKKHSGRVGTGEEHEAEQPQSLGVPSMA